MSKKNEYQGHLIREVYPDSIAEAMEIEPGDVLLRINNQKIEDVFDYRYMIKDEYVEVLIRKPDGEEWLLEIEKEYDDDLGVEFENGLMSDYRSCSNKCIFCFIALQERQTGIIIFKIQGLTHSRRHLVNKTENRGRF